MTASKAKRLLAVELADYGIPYDRLTAKTVHFTDLARASCVFVTVHGWGGRERDATRLEEFARGREFRVDFKEGGTNG